MLRFFQSKNADAAAMYYTESLARQDYYVQGEVVGLWGGKGAERLGLEGPVTRDAFLALTTNLDPSTGEKLTAKTVDDRTVGYDLNWHVPKSLSVLHALTNDERIVDAVRESVSETMRELEAEMKTRVRRDGRNEDRVSGNMISAEFVHSTSRPVGGESDPHLHVHCFVFNATFDEEENRWKAGQFRDLKRDAPYWEAGFHARLARRVRALGYDIERTDKRWEVKGVPKTVIEKFSRRTKEIERLARERGITDPEEKAKLGALSRAGKRKGVSREELAARWDARLDEAEREAVFATVQRAGQERGKDTPELADRALIERASERAMDHAVEHSFERASVISAKRLMAEALKAGVGEVTVESIANQLGRPEVIVREVAGQKMTTTRTVLAEEQAMLDFAREGRGTCAPLGKRQGGQVTFEPSEQLSEEQREAVLHVLSSQDRVQTLRGAAGTGKTTLLKEAVRGIEEGGHNVLAFAPSAEASRGVLRESGFSEAETLARLLADPKLQEKARGQLILVDEAGLVGTRQAKRLFELADRVNARVLLVGDARQHASVERGDALRLLEDRAGIVPAEVTEVRRQQGTYREAVRALERHETEVGLGVLIRMGAVHEVWDDDERSKRIAEDYARTIAERKKALVVSPTHAEGERVTQCIREELRERGALGAEEKPNLRLIDLAFSDAEKKDAATYRPGLVVELHQNVKGAKRGTRLTVTQIDREGGVLVGKRSDGREVRVRLKDAAHFNVYAEATSHFAAGDAIRITKNGTTRVGKHRLDNGARYKVKGFTADGDLILTNGWVLNRAYGHVTHGYVSTSHAVQAKTVDRVIIAQSADSFAASSRQQFYVSASRGRLSIGVYTDSQRDLREAIARDEERLGATELVSRSTRERLADHAREVSRLKGYARAVATREPSREPERTRTRPVKPRGMSHDPGA